MSGDISKLISDAYGTGTPATGASDEDQQKVAEAAFFNDLCEENGINIQKLDDGQVERLYKAAMINYNPDAADDDTEKTAAAKEAEAQKAKEAAAVEEWAEKRAAAEKIAEVDALGRIMAHAYVDELQKIAQGGLPPALAAAAEKKKEEAEGEGKEKEEEKEEEAKKESQAKAEQLIEALSKNASGESTTQNLDDVAAGWAVELLKKAEVPEDVAQRKIAAAIELGLPESTKVAMSQTPEQAAYVRALEICEKAGFEVDWDKA